MISNEENYKVLRNNQTFLQNYASSEGIKTYWSNSGNIEVHAPFQSEEDSVISRENIINKTGDGSITPKTHIHETSAYLDESKSTFVTEYAYVNEEDALQSYVVRFGINTKTDISHEIQKYNNNIKQEIRNDLQNRVPDTSKLAKFIETHENIEIEQIIKDLKKNYIYPKNLRGEIDKKEGQILEKLIKVFKHSFSDIEVREYIKCLTSLDAKQHTNLDEKTHLTQTSVGSAIGNKNISKLVVHLSSEKKIIQLALSTFEQDNYLKTILVDIYARDSETTLINNETEVHTVVLYRPTATSKIFVIDPNNPLFSSHLSNIDDILVTSYSDKIKVYNNKGNKTGSHSDEWRDCIDIAVKLAFSLNAISDDKVIKHIDQNQGFVIDKNWQRQEDHEKFSESLKHHPAILNLTNNQSLNKENLPEEIESFPVRIKQSSNIEISKIIQKVLSIVTNNLNAMIKLSDDDNDAHEQNEDSMRFIIEQRLSVDYSPKNYSLGTKDYCNLQKESLQLLGEHQNTLMEEVKDAGVQ